MNDLFTLHKALSQAMNRDPVLCLAHAVSWLDPFWQTDDDVDFPHDEHDTLMIALHILRRTFPEIYFDALQALRQGASYAQLDTLICDAVQAHGIPLDSLEWMPFGVPLPAYGVELDNPEFYTQHPDAMPLLECFGITSDDTSITEAMYTQAETIANDLSAQPETHWQQIAWSIRWLFGMSGNSSVDLSPEILSEFEPLSWEPEDVAFAMEIVCEAEQIMVDALAGLDYLKEHPGILSTLLKLISGCLTGT